MALDNYILTLINRMARGTGTELTDRHLEILDFAYTHYRSHKVGPALFKLKKALGATTDELAKLFPYGLNSVYTWVGIPIQTVNQTCKPPASLEVMDYRSVYLDHNATTYLRDEVRDLLIEYFSGTIGYANPSSPTGSGRDAHDLLDRARGQIAYPLGVSADSIIFTASGSEAMNLAIRGCLYPHRHVGGHVIASNAEHACVRKTVGALENFEVEYLPIYPDGRVRPADLVAALRPDTRLVTIMAANNEIGALNPIPELAAICRSANVPFAVDAVQAYGKIPLDPRGWGVNLMAMSGHKIYAPKGIGALYVEPGMHLEPIIYGGGQERGLRAGTENVGYILAFGLAAHLAYRELPEEQVRLAALRNRFLEGLRSIEPAIVVNGSLEHRLANNLSVGFPSVDSGAMVLSLGNIGVEVAAGSACSSGRLKDSHVLVALGADTRRFGTIRFSFGLRSTDEDVDYVLKYLPEILRQVKE